MPDLREHVAQISDQYDWERIFGAYRDGRWVPEALEELVSNSDSALARVCDFIFEEANHQKTHYPITGPLCTTLIRLCAIPEFPGRTQLMSLVGEILDLDSETEPLVLRTEGLMNAGMIYWCFNSEMTWYHMSRVHQDIISLVNDPSESVAWLAARILKLAHDRISIYPTEKHFRRPELSDSDWQSINAALSKADQPPSYFDESESDHKWNEPESELGKVISKASRYDFKFDRSQWLSHCGIDTEFLAKIPGMSPDEIMSLDHLLTTHYGWQDDSEFVRVLINVIESWIPKATSEHSEHFLRVLENVEIHQEQAAEICTRIAIEHDKQSFRDIAVQTLVRIQMDEEIQLNYFDRILSLNERETTIALLDAFESTRTHSAALKIVIPHLGDENWRIRFAAVKAFRFFDYEPDSQTDQTLLKLLSDPEHEIRRVAVDAWAGVKQRNLPTKCFDDPNEWVRVAAVRRSRRHEREIERDMPLLIALLDDPSPAVICEAWAQICQSNEWKIDDENLRRQMRDQSNDLATRKAFQKQWQAESASLATDRAQLVLDSITDSTSPQSTLFKWQIAISLSSEINADEAKSKALEKLNQMPEWLKATAEHWLGEI